MHNGKALFGIYRDEKYGCPVGCIRVVEIGQRKVERTTTIADGREEFHAGAVSDAFTRAQAAMRRTTKVTKNADGSEGVEVKASSSGKKLKAVDFR